MGCLSSQPVSPPSPHTIFINCQSCQTAIKNKTYINDAGHNISDRYTPIIGPKCGHLHIDDKCPACSIRHCSIYTCRNIIASEKCPLDTKYICNEHGDDEITLWSNRIMDNKWCICIHCGHQNKVKYFCEICLR